MTPSLVQLDLVADPLLAVADATLDPIDGTRNFTAGISVFAVMVGFLVKGASVASVICDPVVLHAVPGLGASA